MTFLDNVSIILNIMEKRGLILWEGALCRWVPEYKVEGDCDHGK